MPLLKSIYSTQKNLREFFIPSDHQLQALDGLRAFSIIYVVIFHALYLTQTQFSNLNNFVVFVETTPTWLNWIWHGDKGVDMFFIISGFLIASIMIREHQQTRQINIPRFYAHRALRILPVYILALLIAALAKRGGGNSEYFWANLLFINNLLPLEKIFIPWSWSLSIEVQFYFVFPFLLLFLYRTSRPVTMLVSFILIACTIRYAVLLLEPELYKKEFYYHVIKDGSRSFFYFENLYVNLYTRIGPLLLGVSTAYLYYYRHDKISALLLHNRILAHGLCLFALLLIIATTSISLYTPNVIHGAEFTLHYLALARNLFSLGVSIILLLAILNIGFGKVFNIFLSNGFWYPIARGAYSIYLFHIPFLGLAYMTLGVDIAADLSGLHISTSLAAAVIALIYTLIFAIPVYLFIEKPFINIYKNRRNNKASKSQPITSAI